MTPTKPHGLRESYLFAKRALGIPAFDGKEPMVKKERLRLVMAHLRANTSAAKTKGLIVRALRIWRSTTASRKPADRNSSRKASPSFAPAIHANQSLSLALTSGGAGFDRINSAT